MSTTATGLPERTAAVAGTSPFVPASAALVVGAAARLLRGVAARPSGLVQVGVEALRQLAEVAVGTSTLAPARDDRRYRHPAYAHHPLFTRLAQAHLVLESAAEQLVNRADLDEKSRERARFVVRAVTEAIAPSNTVLGNPEALGRAWESRGRSLLAGLARAMDDLRHHGGLPSLADRAAFRVGVDLAGTPGAVVHRDAMFELIQYAPTADRVVPEPLLFVPSQVNRFYVIDLLPWRSLVRHLLGLGHRPFAVSWRNPGPEHRDLGLAQYAAAVRRAVRITREIAAAPVHVVGLCAGGTTAVVALGGRRPNPSVRTLSLAVAVGDTSDPSLLGAFATRRAAEAAAAASRRRGVLTGTQLGRGFALMRPRELIWSLWVHSYLLGQHPPVNDVLFWSDDTTNLPARLHADYLDAYARNPLGRRYLRNVRYPAYVMSGLDDHIAPWTGGWRTATRLGGDTTFVAAAGGHIEALLAVPGRARGYAAGPPEAVDAESWLAAAEWREGSWWDHWAQWLDQRSGPRVSPPAGLGSRKYPVLDAAPGRYVHER